MIPKLLTDILNETVEEISGISENRIYWTIGDKEKSHVIRYINMYEFQHLCKEHMKDKYQLCVWSGNGFNKAVGYECSITHFMFGEVITYKADTEFEAIVSALYAVINDEVLFV